MPLKSQKGSGKKALNKAISANIKELKKDNLKKGKEKGAGGKMRSPQQIIAIAISAAKRNKQPKK